MELIEKLEKLLPHWIEHNEAHCDSYGQWAKNARDAGLSEVAEAIEKAIGAVRLADEALREAASALGSTTS